MATPRATQLARPETVALTPEIQEPFAPLYYPGVLDLSSASQIALSAGAELTDADFHMQRVRAPTVRGRLYSPINDFAGSPIQVVLAHHDDNSASFLNRMSATVDALSGRFEFRGVAPGPYLLVASQVHDGRILSGRMILEIDSVAPRKTSPSRSHQRSRFQGRSKSKVAYARSSRRSPSGWNRVKVWRRARNPQARSEQKETFAFLESLRGRGN